MSKVSFLTDGHKISIAATNKDSVEAELTVMQSTLFNIAFANIYIKCMGCACCFSNNTTSSVYVLTFL